MQLSDLFERYDRFLLDAFGVLLHSTGALPGARELLAAIADSGKSFAVVTNDASRLPESASARYRELGLAIATENVVSSGMLLVDHFRQRDLAGAECLVLGTEDSEEYVRRAGGTVAEHREDAIYDAVIVCDDAGYPFLGTLDLVVSALLRHFDAGREPALILPNPDIVYPKGPSSFGFTAGGVALLLEEVLARRYRTAESPPPRFSRLGKPQPHLLNAALGSTDRRRALMVGDQLETDIAGAQNANVDSLLIESGVSGARSSLGALDVRPTYRAASLAVLCQGTNSPEPPEV